MNHAERLLETLHNKDDLSNIIKTQFRSLPKNHDLIRTELVKLRIKNKVQQMRIQMQSQSLDLLQQEIAQIKNLYKDKITKF